MFFEPGGVHIAFSADVFVGEPDAVLYAFWVEGAEGCVAFMEFGAVDFFHDLGFLLLVWGKWV